MHLHDRSSLALCRLRLCGGAMHFVYDIYKWQTRTQYEFIFIYFFRHRNRSVCKRERMDARVRTRVHTNESKWKRKWSAFFSLLMVIMLFGGCRMSVAGAHRNRRRTQNRNHLVWFFVRLFVLSFVSFVYPIGESSGTCTAGGIYQSYNSIDTAPRALSTAFRSIRLWRSACIAIRRFFFSINIFENAE